MSLRWTGATAVFLLVLAGCTGIPDSGPVVVVEPGEEPSLVLTGRVDPAPPQPGSSPQQLIRDFMDAMQAYPVSTDVAREFLSRDAADSWTPSQETVIYSRIDYAETFGGVVETQVLEQARLGVQGSYYPEIAGQQLQPQQWQLVQEGGEWRIADPPDRLYIGSAYFEEHYRSYNRYFLDPSQTLAIGEPAYFPDGEQLATNLVRALLAGPSPATVDQVRTAIPSRARLDVPTPIGPDGVAEVRLTGPEEELSELQAQLLSVQLVSTLRQVPGVLGVRIVVNDVPLEVSGQDDVQEVSAWSSYVPAANVVERRLFALAARRLVTIEGAFVAPVEGALGQQRQDLRWVVADQNTGQLLGVSRDGHHVLSGAVGDARKALRPIWRKGKGLGRPTHAGSAGAVVVDRTAAGSSMVVVESLGDRVARRVSLGGLAASYVDALSISPDGVRFVAVASDNDNPAAPSRLLTGWVTRGPQGRISGVSGVRPVILSGEQVADVRDAGWVGENRLAFIGRFADSPMQIYTVNTDGSDLSGGQVSGEPLPEELDPVWLATAGLEDAPIYAEGRDGTSWLRETDGQWLALTAAQRLSSATFAG